MSPSKNVLITGTSSGFGYGATRALAKKGHTVFATLRGISAKNESKANELRQWAEQGNYRVHVTELDVTSDDSVKTAVDSIIAKAGKIDVLVNNAGVGTWGLQEAFTIDQVEEVFAVNVFGVLRMNRAVLPHMHKAGDGYLIYVGSGLGRIMLPFLGPYSASKFAIEALAEIGSYELAPAGIDTTILQPGAYGTDFLGNVVHPKDGNIIDGLPKVKAMYEAFDENARAGQMGDPDEVVAAVVELVEAEKARRPLRKTVGAATAQAVNAINDRCAEVQGQLLAAFGLR